MFSCQGDAAFDEERLPSATAKPRHQPSATMAYDEYLKTAQFDKGGVVSKRVTRSVHGAVNISIAQNWGGTLEHQMRSITKQQLKEQRQQEDGDSEEKQMHQPRSPKPTRCCCQRVECTEDVSISQVKCQYTQKPMSALCVCPAASDITYCVTCAPNFV